MRVYNNSNDIIFPYSHYSGRNIYSRKDYNIHQNNIMTKYYLNYN